MQTQKIYPVTQRILLGRCGENNVKKILICVGLWLQEYPNGQFQLMIYPPDGEAYPANLILNDNVLQWTISSADTALVGDGQAQLTMYGPDGQVGRSCTMTTRVLPSRASQEKPDMPQYITPWVDTIAKMSADAKRGAAQAKQSEENAAASAEQAGGYATEANQAKVAAQAAQLAAQQASANAQQASQSASDFNDEAQAAAAQAIAAKNQAVIARNQADQYNTQAYNYKVAAEGARDAASGYKDQAKQAKSDAVNAKQQAQAALQQLVQGIESGDFKGEKGDTPTITSERNGNVTTILSDGVAVAQILDGTNGSDATVTKQNIEAALNYVPANDATAMIYKQVIFDGTKFTDDTGEQLTFSQLKTLCLDHKHFVYCTYENDLYIPQHVQPTQIYFDATYIRNHQAEIHRVGININGSVNQQVVYPQEKLVSGTNIKTINNESILGSGDIHIDGGANIDSTLTIHGNAADAGVVGQQIEQIKEDYRALYALVLRLKEIVESGGTTEYTCAMIDQLIVEYFESKTVSEVER